MDHTPWPVTYISQNTALRVNRIPLLPSHSLILLYAILVRLAPPFALPTYLFWTVYGPDRGSHRCFLFMVRLLRHSGKPLFPAFPASGAGCGTAGSLRPSEPQKSVCGVGRFLNHTVEGAVLRGPTGCPRRQERSLDYTGCQRPQPTLRAPRPLAHRSPEPRATAREAGR